MHKDCKHAIDEARSVLADLALFLVSVQKRDPAAAHPDLDYLAERLDGLVSEIDELNGSRHRRTGT
jgi:hypothetical protein